MWLVKTKAKALKTWVVLFVACILFLVIVIATLCSSGGPSAMHGPVTLPKHQVDNEMHHTGGNLVPPYQDHTDSTETRSTHIPVPFHEDQENCETQRTLSLSKDKIVQHINPVQPPTDHKDTETQHTDSPVQPPEDHKNSETQLNTTDVIHQRLVVFTAFSSNHFREARDMIGSVQKYLPRAKIIVYDIGLSTEQRGVVSKYCDVELQSFNFTKYPPHVKKDLHYYAWKPLVLQEMVDQGYDVILFGDASLRIKVLNITPALQSLLEFPFLNLVPANRPIISLTHDKTLQYFQFPPSRQYMAQWKTVQSGSWLILVNDRTRKKLIAPWVDCALHKDCIAPDGARVLPCDFAKQAHNYSYAGCHRFDQSALNIILAKNFGLKVWDKVVRRDMTEQLATAVRSPQGIYPVKHYPHCNDT